MHSQRTEDHSSTALIVSVALAIWLALVFLLGAAGAFIRPLGTLPFPIIIGVTLPIIFFLTAFWWSRAFREFVLAVDPRLAAGIQAWRFAGFGFLALYAHGVLPGLFAWPAGLGDIGIGVTAPWVILALIRNKFWPLHDQLPSPVAGEGEGEGKFHAHHPHL